MGGPIVAPMLTRRATLYEGTGDVFPQFFLSMADTDIFFSYSVLPALSLEGVIFSDIVKGSYDGKKFVQFVDELMNVMNPYPGKHSVLVMVNCQICHVPEVEEVCTTKYV